MKSGTRAQVWASGQASLFGDQLPSFQRPGGAHDRIGVVDVGSNSVRMVVFEGGRRCPAMVFNEKVMCGLGAELAETGRLAPEGVERALRALRRFVMLAPGLRVGALAGVATAAVRDAEDGPAFCRRVARETNIRLDVASGADEARLAAQGVLFGDPRAAGLVVDLGGASMELCPIVDGEPGRGVSTPLGPLRLRSLGRASVREAIDEALHEAEHRFRAVSNRLYLVGGAWRALGRVQINLAQHPLPVLHEYAFSRSDARDLLAFVKDAGREKLAELPGVPGGRLSTLPYAVLLMEGLLEAFHPSEVVISGFGLREGVCYECLPEAVRLEDPLLSTAVGQEFTRARAPGFGAELFRWMKEAAEPVDEREARLIQAACHLADVSWRAHPDIRANACLEVVTRVNISGAGHAGRVFIGATLISRYKGGRKALAEEPALALLNSDEIDRAMALGALMRLGATLAGATPGFLPHCPLIRQGGILRLAPARRASSILGEEVDKRLSQAARALGLEPDITP